MLSLIGGELRFSTYPPVLTDPQWNRIAELSGLPDEARVEIDDSIGYFRELKADAVQTFGDKWYNALLKAKELQEKSIASLRQLASDQRFSEALAMGLEGQERVPDPEIKEISEWLRTKLVEAQKLSDWYDQAMTRVHYFAQTGPKTGRNALLALVRGLDDILERHTGSHISTSKQRDGKKNSFEYIAYVCAIADTKSGTKDKDQQMKTIKKAMEPIISENIDGFFQKNHAEGWGHLMPEWEEAKSFSLKDDQLGIELLYEADEECARWSAPKCERDIKLPSSLRLRKK